MNYFEYQERKTRKEPTRSATDGDTVDIPGILVTESEELDQETIERAILAAWKK